MTVAPSGLATQAIGEAAPVAEGVWQLNIVFPLGASALYEIWASKGGNGPELIVDPLE